MHVYVGLYVCVYARLHAYSIYFNAIQTILFFSVYIINNYAIIIVANFWKTNRKPIKVLTPIITLAIYKTVDDNNVHLS